MNHLESFGWLREFSRPVLGICAGMQIIGLVFGGKISEKQEIGHYREEFVKDFLGLFGKQEIYHLHNNFILSTENFENFTNSEIVQAMRHSSKEIYGCLFHPEVRNKEIVRNFIKL